MDRAVESDAKQGGADAPRSVTFLCLLVFLNGDSWEGTHRKATLTATKDEKKRKKIFPRYFGTCEEAWGSQRRTRVLLLMSLPSRCPLFVLPFPLLCPPLNGKFSKWRLFCDLAV